MTRFPILFIEPIAPFTVMLLVPAFMVKSNPPSTVLPNRICCERADVSRIVVPIRVIGLSNSIELFEAMCTARLTGPLPFCRNSPPRFQSTPEFNVSVPLFVTKKLPLLVKVLTPLEKVKFVPIKLRPKPVVVVTWPLKVVVPVPAACEIEPTLTAAVVTLCAEVTFS